MATKKKKPKQLNRFPDGVHRDGKKDKKLQMTEWMKKLVNKLKSEKQSGSFGFSEVVRFPDQASGST